MRCLPDRRFVFLLISSILCQSLSGMALAQSTKPRPLIAVAPVVVGDSIDLACSETIYQTLLPHPTYHLLPDWHVQHVLQPFGAADLNKWTQHFETLTEIDFLILTEIQSDQNASKTLSSVLIQRGQPPQIVKSAVLPMLDTQSCARLAESLMGQSQAERFQSPPLSAALSLVVPGAGHLYRGNWDGILMGASFLATSLTMAYLGFADITTPQVTHAQWGGMMLLVTLMDVVTAYFMTPKQAN